MAEQLPDGTRRGLPAAQSAGLDDGLVAALAPVGLAGFDTALACTWANPRFGDLVARPHAEAPGLGWAELLPLTRAQDLRRVRRVLGGEAAGADFLVVMRDRAEDSLDPPEVWRLHVYPLTDHGEVVGLGVLAQDVTDDEVELTDLRRRAETDGLTGLLNRTAFHDLLRRATPAPDPGAPGGGRRPRPASPVMLLLVVDLDEFKAVNDTHGHAVGDVVLAETGRRLRKVLDPASPGEAAGRIGGDEFAVLCRASRGRRAVVDEIRTVLTRPVAVGPGLWVSPQVTIGHATLQEASPEASLASADAAMYVGKRVGRRPRGSVHLAPAATQDTGQDRDIDLTDPVLDRATAVVMRRTGCDPRRAVGLLARYARTSGRSLVQVAHDLDSELDGVAWEQLDRVDDLGASSGPRPAAPASFGADPLRPLAPPVDGTPRRRPGVGRDDRPR